MLGKIIIIYIINFLSVVSINMTNPIIPQIITSLGLPTFMFGMFFASTSLATFIFSPIWGYISDVRGRKKVISIGLIGFGLSQIGLCISSSMIMISIFRFTGGVFIAAYVTSAISYLSDMTDENNRGKYISYYTAISTLGTSVGSLIGGISGNLNYSYTFLMQILFTVITLIIIQCGIKNDNRNKDLVTFSSALKIDDFKFLQIKASVGMIMISTIFMSFAISSYNSSIAYYIESVFNLSPAKIGVILSMNGIVSIFVNFVVNPYLLKTIKDKYVFVLSSIFSGISMIGAIISENIYTSLVFLIIYLILSNINMPLHQLIISKVSVKNKGSFIGIQNSARSVGMIAASLIAAFVFDINNKLPFIIGGSSFILGGVIFLISNIVLIRKDRMKIS